ncbi:hypothetical protein Hypma_001394 [Hypsizygus marmoreus]|uniref:Uncharacterized protein n=1 Tax=Hypsizygus marmoreus TaxID=39966 RepID=A0A369K3U0_HYPMA|nr:hypothetical protein Hypma_001394 [Hypsizygus marmoreus]
MHSAKSSSFAATHRATAPISPPPRPRRPLNLPAVDLSVVGSEGPHFNIPPGVARVADHATGTFEELPASSPDLDNDHGSNHEDTAGTMPPHGSTTSNFHSPAPRYHPLAAPAFDLSPTAQPTRLSRAAKGKGRASGRRAPRCKNPEGLGQQSILNTTAASVSAFGTDAGPSTSKTSGKRKERENDGQADQTTPKIPRIRAGGPCPYCGERLIRQDVNHVGTHIRGNNCPWGPRWNAQGILTRKGLILYNSRGIEFEDACEAEAEGRYLYDKSLPFAGKNRKSDTAEPIEVWAHHLTLALECMVRRMKAGVLNQALAGHARFWLKKKKNQIPAAVEAYTPLVRHFKDLGYVNRDKRELLPWTYDIPWSDVVDPQVPADGAGASDATSETPTGPFSLPRPPSNQNQVKSHQALEVLPQHSPQQAPQSEDMASASSSQSTPYGESVLSFPSPVDGSGPITPSDDVTMPHGEYQSEYRPLEHTDDADILKYLDFRDYLLSPIQPSAQVVQGSHLAGGVDGQYVDTPQMEIQPNASAAQGPYATGVSLDNFPYIDVPQLPEKDLLSELFSVGEYLEPIAGPSNSYNPLLPTYNAGESGGEEGIGSLMLNTVDWEDVVDNRSSWW